MISSYNVNRLKNSIKPQDLIIVGIVHDLLSSGYIFYNKSDKLFYIYDSFFPLNKIYSSALSSECTMCYNYSEISGTTDINYNLISNFPLESCICWESSNYISDYELYSGSSTYYPSKDIIITDGNKSFDVEFSEIHENISDNLKLFNDEYEDYAYGKTHDFVKECKEKIDSDFAEYLEMQKKEIEKEFLNDEDFDDYE